MIISKLKLMRLHQPVGIFLLLWPCLISLGLANRGTIDLKLTIIFIIGSILMRSAGCIINDLIDRNIDNKVLRTKNRPITNGDINVAQASKLLVMLLLASASLLFFLNKLAVLISLGSLILVVIYPFCKRYTYWVQFILGFTYNIGVLIAWAAVKNTINAPAIILYIGCVFWTVGYDTIYAHQDIKDDLKLGLKSTAIKFGEKTEQYLRLFYTIFATMLVFSGSISRIGAYYNLFLVLPIILLFWQVYTLDIHDTNNCARRFKSNILVGGFIYLASILTRYI